MSDPATRCTFLGWYDPDRKKSAADKLAAAINRHRTKFGTDAVLCLCHPEDASELGAERLGVTIEGRGSIARHMYFVGKPDDEEGDARDPDHGCERAADTPYQDGGVRGDLGISRSRDVRQSRVRDLAGASAANP